jgi:diguanylate cyclase (GGDEF)-like protein
MVDEARMPIRTATEAIRALATLVERTSPAGWTLVRGSVLTGMDLHGDDGTVESWPLVLPDGTVVGLARRDPQVAGADDALVVALLQTATALVEAERRAGAAEARAAEAEEESRLDPLTGLANRRQWELTLMHEQARSRRTGSSAVVLVVDVDGLKEANDSQGHLAGDILLRTTAAALQRSVREGDIVARLGGDEFGILAVDWQGPVPESLVERVCDAMEAVDVSASVGGAVPEFGESLLGAFHRADEAMYEAKRVRKSRPGAAAS